MATAFSAASSSSVALAWSSSNVERQLIDQPRRAFRSLPIDLTLQPGDPQFLLGNQGCIFGRFRASDRQRLFQGSDVIGNGLGRSIHNNDRIINAAI